MGSTPPWTVPPTIPSSSACEPEPSRRYWTSGVRGSGRVWRRRVATRSLQGWWCILSATAYERERGMHIQCQANGHERIWTRKRRKTKYLTTLGAYWNERALRTRTRSSGGTWTRAGQQGAQRHRREDRTYAPTAESPLNLRETRASPTAMVVRRRDADMRERRGARSPAFP